MRFTVKFRGDEEKLISKLFKTVGVGEPGGITFNEFGKAAIIFSIKQIVLDLKKEKEEKGGEKT